MASKDAPAAAAAEEKDTFVIPIKYSLTMMMFNMASGGKNVITLEQVCKLIRMPLTEQGIPNLKKQWDAIKAQQKNFMKNSVEAADKAFDSAVTKLVKDLPKFIKPLFSIIDMNDSGTISRKEFYHMARIFEWCKSICDKCPEVVVGKRKHFWNRRNRTIDKFHKGMQKSDMSVELKTLLDIVFDLLDTDGDHCISKAEITRYFHRIVHALGQFADVVLNEFSALVLVPDVFDSIAEDVYKYIPVDTHSGGLGFANLVDDKGNVSYAKCAPLLATVDTKLHAMLAQAKKRESPAKVALIVGYLKMEKQIVDDLKTDDSGQISKAAFLSAVKGLAKVFGAELKQQLPALLAALPRDQQNAMMVFAGVVQPADLVEKILSADDDFVFELYIDALFENFGGNGGKTMNMAAVGTMMNLVIGFADPSQESNTAQERMKSAFGLLDADADGSISAKEAARVVGGVARCSAAFLGGLIRFYLEFLADPDMLMRLLVIAEAFMPWALSAALPQGAMVHAGVPTFPLKKTWVEGLITFATGKKVKANSIEERENQAKLKKLQEDYAKANQPKDETAPLLA